MRRAREITIAGSVQGVGFRWTAKRIADGMDIDGWARNDPDGGVTLRIAGDEAELDAFIERLGEVMGVYMTSVESRDVQPGEERGGFAIRR